MGSFSRSLANILFGWVSGVISKIWAMINTDSGTELIPWSGKKWLLIVATLCVLGLVIDLVVYAFRWRPHKVWISAFNRIRNKWHKKDNKNANVSGNIAEESYQGYSVQNTEPEMGKDLPHGSRSVGGVSSDNEQTVRYVPERVQRKEIQPAEDSYEYERRYARPEGERQIRNEAVRNSTKTTGYVAPRRKHVMLSELTEDDEDFLLNLKRNRKATTRIDPEDAYNAPVYPPQWKMKSNTGENTDNE